MPDENRNALVKVSRAALDRYQMISQVRARVLAGEPLARAVRAVAALEHVTLAGDPARVSVRSLYRWLREYQMGGLEALDNAARAPGPPSEVLPAPLVDFLAAEKKLDRYASVPELIRRARERAIIGRDQRIDRTTVWRTCQRLGLPLRRVPDKHEADQRRWAYPHRMMMVLADGKHFRAGPHRRRRVALFFLDDATRKGLGSVVGPSESCALFLRGLYLVIGKVGLFDAIYLDGGPGFIADDTHTVLARLGIALIIGRPRYPEGHGKIERFNQTAGSQVLRGLDGAADVDDEPAALELRLSYYLHEQYNHHLHEAFAGKLSPLARWEADTRALRFPDDAKALRDCFVVTESRQVSADHVISYAGTDYEVPRGHARTEIQVTRHVLDGMLSVVHDGRRVTLHPVDLARNALDRRGRPEAQPQGDDEGVPRTAAALAFSKEFRPVVQPDGGCPPITRTGEPT